MTSDAVYLDHNATTPVAAPVLEAMLPFLREAWGNAASTQHTHGRRAAAAVDSAREEVAALLDARAAEIVFTAGATESNNLALKGAVEAAPPGRGRVLIGDVEHRSVLDVGEWLRARGVAVEVVPVGPDGVVDVAALAGLLGPDVVVVSVMAANNETGVLQPVAEIARLAHDVGALVHCDATQIAGRLPFSVEETGVDLASLSAHKMYGPKGVGALFVRRRTALAPQMLGGGHERGLRSGTANVPGIVGFGAAAALAVAEADQIAVRDGDLSGLLLDELRAQVPDIEEIGADAPRLPNTRCVRFPVADAEAVMANAPGVACSTGSACTRHVPEPSHVLLAMGLTAEAAYECLRFSVGRAVDSDGVRRAATDIAAAVARVRELNAAAAPAGGGTR